MEISNYSVNILRYNVISVYVQKTENKLYDPNALLQRTWTLYATIHVKRLPKVKSGQNGRSSWNELYMHSRHSMHILWYAGHCRIIDLVLYYKIWQCHTRLMSRGKLKFNIWLTILCFIPNLIIRSKVKFLICVLYGIFKCHPRSYMTSYMPHIWLPIYVSICIGHSMLVILNTANWQLNDFDLTFPCYPMSDHIQ